MNAEMDLETEFDMDMNTDTNDENIQDDGESARKNHREIERRRRLRLKQAMMDLAKIIPGVSGLSREPDKVTLLRMSNAHLETLPEQVRSKAQINFLFQELVLADAGDGFQFVLDVASNQILYSSETIRRVLLQDPRDWIGTSILDQIHPDDVKNFKEQFLGIPTNPWNPQKERILDLKTGTVKRDKNPTAPRPPPAPISKSNSSSASGSKESEPPPVLTKCICRFKLGSHYNDVIGTNSVDEKRSAKVRANSLGGQTFSQQQNYAVLHLSGFIKNLSIANLLGGSSSGFDSSPRSSSSFSSNSSFNCRYRSNSGSSSTSYSNSPYASGEESQPSPSITHPCFIVIGRRQMAAESDPSPCISNGVNISPGSEFMTRLDVQGKFCFVDEKVRPLLNFMPQQLLGQSFIHSLVHPEDQGRVSAFFQEVIMTRECLPPENSPMISFRCRYQFPLRTCSLNGSSGWVHLKTTAFPFHNPSSAELEFILCTNTVLGPVSANLDSREFHLQSQSQQQHEKIGRLEEDSSQIFQLESDSDEGTEIAGVFPPPHLQQGTVAFWEWMMDNQINY